MKCVLRYTEGKGWKVEFHSQTGCFAESLFLPTAGDAKDYAIEWGASVDMILYN